MGGVYISISTNVLFRILFRAQRTSSACFFFTHGAQAFSTVPTHMHVSCTFPSPISSSRTFHLPSSSQPSRTPVHVPCTFPSPVSSSSTLPSGSPTGSDAAGARFQVWFFHALYKSSRLFPNRFQAMHVSKTMHVSKPRPSMCSSVF